MKRLLYIIFIFALIPDYVRPETGIGFAEAAGMAVEASVELRNEYAAKALREGAWFWGARAYLPRLSIIVSEDDRLSQTGSDSFIKNYSVNFEQLLWDGGRLSLSRRMERAELDLAGSRLKQTASDIAGATVSAYRDVLYGRMILEIRKNALESLYGQLRILRRETELGLVRQTDLIEAEITVAMTELDILSLEVDLEEAERRFAEMLGLENMPLLSERIDTERSPLLPSPAAAGSFAVARNIELASLRFSVTRRQAEVKAASTSWIPSLRLTGSFGISGRQYPLSRYNWTIGISVDFASPFLSGSFGASTGAEPPYDRNAMLQQTLTPVPDPGAAFSSQTAKLALINERSRYEAAVREVRAAAEMGVNLCRLLDNKRILAMEALALQGDMFRLAELRLSIGEITRIELMEARMEYARREAALVEAASAVLRAEWELERLLNLGPGELAAIAEYECGV